MNNYQGKSYWWQVEGLARDKASDQVRTEKDEQNYRELKLKLDAESYKRASKGE